MDSIQIVIGVPGSWPDRAALNAALSQNGFAVSESELTHEASGQSFGIEVYGHDSQLERAFSVAGRGALESELLESIATHTQSIYLFTDDSSVERATACMAAGADLMHAGGLALKIESTGVAHSSDAWLELSTLTEPTMLLEAFVTYVSGEDCFHSCGMHNLGLPDALVPAGLTSRTAAGLLFSFGAYVLLDAPDLQDGDTFSQDENSQRYRLTKVPCHLYSRDNLFYNENGVWRLDPAS